MFWVVFSSNHIQYNTIYILDSISNSCDTSNSSGANNSWDARNNLDARNIEHQNKRNVINRKDASIAGTAQTTRFRGTPSSARSSATAYSKAAKGRFT
jgi:hypothetical protein